MRQFLFGLSISVAFIVGCVTAQHVPELGVPTASAYAGPAWQYTCTSVAVLGFSVDRTAEALGTELASMGADGWELIPVPVNGGSMLCFKRPA